MKKKLKNIIKRNVSRLEASNKRLCDIYSIMFSSDAVIAEDTDGIRVNSYTYKETEKRICEVSSALHQKIGATHNFVALEMENSIDWIVAFWAILRSGNKPYLVNCRHPKLLTDSALRTLGIRYVIGNSSTELDAEFIDISTLKTSEAFEGDFEDEIALSTSATSLNETICFYSGAQLSSQILNVDSFIGKYPEIASQYKGRIKNLAFLPFYHIFGLVAVYFWFTFFEQTVVFLKNYSSDTILKTCRKLEVTHIFAVPLLWHTIESAVLKKLKENGEKKTAKFYSGLSLCTKLQNVFPHMGMNISQKIMKEVTNELFGQSVRFCINGGSYIRQSALEMMNGIGYNLHNGYGMSEIGISSVELRMKPKHKNLNSIGQPFSSLEYKIDENGILHVKGSSICSSVVTNGKAETILGWYNTGDVVECIDGYYYIKGRMGDVVIGDNGENINPDIIEQSFSLPEAEAISVLGTVENGKEVLTLIVQVSKYMSDTKKNLLYDKIAKANQSLPLSSRVQKIYFTNDAISAASAVKVSRKWLLRAISEGTVRLSDFIKAENLSEDEITYNDELYNCVVKVIAKTLDVATTDITRDTHIMLDLGASSIQYFSILSELSEEFSITSSSKDELCYTPHEMCKYIERHL